MTAGDLAAIVLGYGTSGEHLPLLDGLLEQGVQPGRVTLVHNPAGAGEPAPSAPPGVRVMRMATNVGYAAAMNAALRARLAEGAGLLLVTTHDCRLRPDAVERLLATARAVPRAGVVGPVLWSRDGDEPWSYGGIREPWGHLAHRQAPPPGPLDGAFAESEWVDGAAMLLRAEMLREVGLFEERFFMYFDEPDLCLRARRAGWRVGVAVGAAAEQSPGASRRPGAYFYLDCRNGLEYARRAEGWRGVRRLVAGKLRVTFNYAKWLVKEPLDPAVRRQAWTELAATWMGVADFARRHWGPPPRWLPGLGDVEP